ncbi:MAG TPA: DUF5990 family protein [Caulobacteraceae bacterium]|nr:DUF5990 family protein [Caulobacteraceae bacterium]
MAEGEVRMRLIRADDTPATNPDNDAYDFGLQDTKGNVIPAARDAQGRFVFDFRLTVKPGKDPNHPTFGGPFASGPADDRFVYLAWRSKARGVRINRIKARLQDIDWSLVREAQSSGRRITADLTGRLPHGGRAPAGWRLE